MTKKRTVKFDNFRGGEAGMLGLENAPAGSFHGSNLMVYSDGLLGPRPGLKNHTPDGMPNGLLRMLVESPTEDREGIFMIANTVYYSSFRDFSINPVALTGSATGFGYAVFPKPDTATFLIAIPDVVASDGSGGVYRINQVAGTVTKLSDSPPSSELEIYSAQLITNDQLATGPRLFGSLPGDFEDWPSEYFIDIGDDWRVVALRKQGDFLVVFKRSSIHTLSGVFGEDTMFVRDEEYNVNGIVDKPWHVDVDADGRIWYIPLFRESIASYVQGHTTHYGHLNHLSPRENEDADLPLKRGISCFDGQLNGSSVIAVQGADSGNAVVQHNGIWTYHHFETTVSGMVRGFGDHYIITDGGDAGAPAQIYMGVFNLDRPAFVSDSRSSPGDGSDTPLENSYESPIWLNDNGNDIRVRSISLQIKKWDTGVETNTLTCQIKTINRPNGAGDVLNEERTWSEDAAIATTDGVHDRIVLPGISTLGQGFQVILSDLVGCAVESYTIDFEEYATPRDN